MFYYEFYEIFESTFFIEHLSTTAADPSDGWYQSKRFKNEFFKLSSFIG